MRPLRIAFILALLSATGSLAEEALYTVESTAESSVRSSLAIFLEQAWRRHPQAAALDAREAEARAVSELAAGLTPEPASLSIANRSDHLNRNVGHREFEVELATPLWLPGQRAARESEAARRIEESLAKRAALRWELAGEVRDAWWRLAAVRNAQALVLRRLETARALESDVRRRYKAGELSRIDANVAQGEVHIAETELIEAGATLLDAEQAFQVLTGAPAPQEIAEESRVIPENRREPLESPESHPQLAALAAAERSARLHLKVVEESRRAAPELALRVVRERGVFDEPYANSVGIRLKIPFSSGAQVRRETSAAQAEADQATSEMLRGRSRVQLDAQRWQRVWQSMDRQLALAQERRELSAENLRLAEKAFRLGESDLATLLRLRAAAFDADAFFDRQRVARAAAISRLNQAQGVLP